MDRTIHQGDNGTTDFPCNGRIPKHDDRIAFLGTMDEVDSLLGLAMAHGVPTELHAELHTIQRYIFRVNSLVALGPVPPPGLTPSPRAMLDWLDKLVERWTAELPQLHGFIYPGGSPAAATIHVARAVCRRAERILWQINEQAPVNETVLAIVNRLSLVLYLLARACNVLQHIPEEEVGRVD